MINSSNAKQTNKPIWHKFGKLFITLFVCLFIFFITLTTSPWMASACCTGCTDVSSAMKYIRESHDDLIDHTEKEWDDDLGAYQDWLINTLLNEEVAVATAMMVTQMSALAMQYTQIIGAFLDAQTQLDTQRVLRQLHYEAHRDYIPSETFCYFGTNVRSLAATEEKGRFNALALSSMSLDRQMGNVHMAGSANAGNDHKARWEQFVHTYCDPLDNNFQDVVMKVAGTSPLENPLNLKPKMARTGLVLACDHDGSESGTDIGAADENRFNRDINYTRLIEKPRTLEMDLSDNTTNSTIDPVSALYVAPINQPGDEEDVIAMSKNLYGHNVLSRRLSRIPLARDNAQRLYLALRSVAAKRNVAQASYNAIVALKSAGTTHEMTGRTNKPKGTSGTVSVNLNAKQTRSYMAAIIEQLLPADPKTTAANIFSLIGYSPSHFSQLEILAKRIYQDPSFYADLYETPANVSRKKVAMKAIELMVDRAIYESQIRREMSISVLLASKLRALHREANKAQAVAKGQED